MCRRRFSSEPFAYAAAETATTTAHDQFSLNPPTPQQLAKAVFNRPITGRPFGLHGVTEKESHQDCMTRIKQVLREYFYELELFTNKNNLSTRSGPWMDTRILQADMSPFQQGALAMDIVVVVLAIPSIPSCGGARLLLCFCTRSKKSG